MSARVFQQPNKPPFAFVKFNSVAEATQAILALNGVVLGTSMLEVRFADSDIGSHTERVAPPSDNVFIRGFAPGSSENDLRMLFSPYGLVISARILHHGEQSGQGAAGLVRMASMEEAGRAVLALNGQRLQGCASTLVARFADSLEIKARKQAKQPLGPNQSLPQQSSMGPLHFETSTPTNSMGMAGSSGSTGKLLLYETFAPYGAIHSVEVLEDSSASEGDRKCGLVSFVHADAAARAMAALHKQPPTASGQLLNLEVQTK
ncbi:uncharacterized protein HaLaN_00371 [Haematococcus lacustris]|uniref:RRM domain-containing protein n=1 Tax=Haematococcus lacustris TaxID=44745 RepID=A0A699Y962_HAELA|nr:uncharacterized protein HaLaN_00371 [Haematococcus lacustris]